ncbi:MAG: hypothetical protein J6X75_02880 [Clostridia bacterium]|nr:hypothetical protein [Clostridia bacterium]
MSKETKKRLSLSTKIIIITAILAIIFLGLSIGAAFASPIRAYQAVKEIGIVAYTAESKERIDSASRYYNSIGKNGLGESRHIGAFFVEQNRSLEIEEILLSAKKEYVRLAIRAVEVADQRKEVEHKTDEDIVKLIAKADEAVEEYFKGDYDQIETYSVLLTFKDKYNVLANVPTNQNSGNSEDVDIELC